MRILALDTSSRAGSVAVWHDGACRVLASRTGDRTHVERLPGEIIDALAEEGSALADVDLFAVIAGPGSFTGLRVGIACIQGFALAGGQRVVSIPTLEAMVAAWLKDADPSFTNRLVVACLDGQRGEIFASAYAVDAACREVERCRVEMPPTVGQVALVASAVSALAAGRPIELVGDAALPCASLVVAPSIQVTTDLPPLAGVAAALAAGRTDLAVVPHALRVIYVRRPDAVLARERARSSLSDAAR